MPSLCARLNYRNIELHADTSGQAVGVRRRNGEYRYLRWLGFMDADAARKLPEAKPVLLDIARYRDDDHFGANWVDLPAGHFVQGCLVECGVYAVTCPRIKLVTKETHL